MNKNKYTIESFGPYSKRRSYNKKKVNQNLEGLLNAQLNNFEKLKKFTLDEIFKNYLNVDLKESKSKITGLESKTPCINKI